MSTHHRFALGASTLALAVLVGCGGGEAEGLARAKAAVAGKDAKTATIELKSFLQKHPKSAEGRYLLGQQLAASGEFAAAVPEFQRALESGHAKDEVIPPMARAILKTGDVGKLLSMFKDEKLAQPEAMASLGASVAMAMAVQGDTAGAKAHIDQVLNGAPKSVPARLMRARLEAAANHISEGMQTLDTLLAEQPGNAEVWSAKGDFMLRVPGGQQAAAGAFAKAVGIDPNDLHALNALVSVHMAMGNTEAAKKAMAQLKKAAPNKFDTARSEGALAYAVGDHARARELFQALLKAAPTNLQVLLLAGENELRLGATAQAEAMFAKASALAPTNGVARRLLAQAQLKQGQAAKALVTLAPLLDAPEASAEVLALAAEARLLNGEAKAADALYTQLAKLKPADPRLRTIVATAGFGRASDDAVFHELRDIATNDKGTTADMALVAAHMQRGQVDAALKALTAIDGKLPPEPRRIVMRGQILSSKKDWAGARQAFEAALALDAGYMPAHAALAALDARDGKPELATQRFQTLLKRQPNNANVMLALAELAEQQGTGQAEALKLRVAAVKAAPANVNARLALVNHHLTRRNFEPALEAAQSAVASMPDNLELLELLGRCQLSEHQSSQAIATFGKIINLTPKSPHGHALSAAAHLRNGDDESARRSIDRALQLSPDHVESLSLAVKVAMRKRQPVQALELARKVQMTRPADALGWMLEGDVESSRANATAAVAAYQKSIGKQNSAEAPRKLYATLVRANMPKDAATFADQWSKSHPRDAEFVYFMGDLAQTRGELAAATRLYERTLGLAPNHAWALNNLAMLRIQSKQAGAMEIALRASQAAPNEPAVLDTLAMAQAMENRLSEAIATQTRALELAPDAPDFRLSLARLLVQAGEKAKAKIELDKLRGLGTRFSRQDEVTKLLQSIGRG